MVVEGQKGEEGVCVCVLVGWWGGGGASEKGDKVKGRVMESGTQLKEGEIGEGANSGANS